MSIDIDKLTVEELEDLNHPVVERSIYLGTLNTRQAMMALSIGTQVSFDSS